MANSSTATNRADRDRILGLFEKASADQEVIVSVASHNYTLIIVLGSQNPPFFLASAI